MDVTVLAALAEPNRLRIVEFLAAAPHTVGEIATGLQLRQPQVSKHLQTLQRAGLVQVHQLGRRKICALRRAGLRELARWAEPLAEPNANDATLDRYRAAIASAASAALPAATLHRRILASRAAVWRAFTEPTLATRWWHPRHFDVIAFRLDPYPSGGIELVLREGDGTQHRAAGTVHTIVRPGRLAFTLDPLDPDGQPLFTARHDLRLTARDGGTDLALTLTPSELKPGAEFAAAGFTIGWEQLLDNLHRLTADGGLAPASGRRPDRGQKPAEP